MIRLRWCLDLAMIAVGAVLVLAVAGFAALEWERRGRDERGN